MLIYRSNPFDHITSQEIFYQAPVRYLEQVFPDQPIPLQESVRTGSMSQKPSHVVLFGELLSAKDNDKESVSVEDALDRLGYEQVWYGWNGFDMAQDESERRGGVYVWAMSPAT